MISRISTYILGYNIVDPPFGGYRGEKGKRKRRGRGEKNRGSFRTEREGEKMRTERGGRGLERVGSGGKPEIF